MGKPSSTGNKEMPCGEAQGAVMWNKESNE